MNHCWGDVEQRLQSLVCERTTKGAVIYQISRHPEIVRIREKDTGDEIECFIPHEGVCVQWSLSTGLFGFLQKDRNADGILLVCKGDGTADAHVIECKTTIGAKTWLDVVEQMRWSVCRILALAAVIGVRLERITLVTAFRHDAVARKTSTSPVQERRPILPANGNRDDVEVVRAPSAWNRSEVHLRGFAKPFPLAKIQIDPQTGRGTYLAPPNP